MGWENFDTGYLPENKILFISSLKQLPVVRSYNDGLAKIITVRPHSICHYIM